MIHLKSCSRFLVLNDNMEDWIASQDSWYHSTMEEGSFHSSMNLLGKSSRPKPSMTIHSPSFCLSPQWCKPLTAPRPCTTLDKCGIDEAKGTCKKLGIMLCIKATNIFQNTNIIAYWTHEIGTKQNGWSTDTMNQSEHGECLPWARSPHDTKVFTWDRFKHVIVSTPLSVVLYYSTTMGPRTLCCF